MGWDFFQIFWRKKEWNSRILSSGSHREEKVEKFMAFGIFFPNVLEDKEQNSRIFHSGSS